MSIDPPILWSGSNYIRDCCEKFHMVLLYTVYTYIYIFQDFNWFTWCIHLWSPLMTLSQWTLTNTGKIELNLAKIKARHSTWEWFVAYYVLIHPWWRHQIETFLRFWPFVLRIHRSPVNSPHECQWRGALMFSLIWTMDTPVIWDAIALIMTSW